MNKRAWLMCASLCVALAVAPASAQATPGSLEFGKCFAKSGGKYANAGCTKLAKPGKESDEWEPLTSGVASNGAKERETGEAVLESAGGAKIHCAAMSQSEGEFGPGSKEESNIVWTFTGCATGTVKCASTGASEGEILWNKLRGVPGVVTREAKEEKDIIGVAFSPQSGTNDAEFQCGPAPFIVRGSVIVRMQADSTGGTSGELTNKMLNKFELEFLTEKGSKQVPEKFEGEPAQTLETSISGAPFEQTGLSLIYVQQTSPKTTKVELRKCEMNVC